MVKRAAIVPPGIRAPVTVPSAIPRRRVPVTMTSVISRAFPVRICRVVMGVAVRSRVITGSAMAVRVAMRASGPVIISLRAA